MNKNQFKTKADCKEYLQSNQIMKTNERAFQIKRVPKPKVFKIDQPNYEGFQTIPDEINRT